MSELKKWQNEIEVSVGCHELTAPRLFTVMRDKTNELQKKLDSFESLVKTVDPDNLPDCDVLALNDEGEFFTTCFIKSDGDVEYYYSDNFTMGYVKNKMRVTQYVEQKDLLELFEAVK